jgi:hypothetical protein
MSSYSEFFLRSKSSVVKLETLEISHPNFTKVYRVVRNAVAGISAKLETGETVEFEYYPLRITMAGARDDLDSSIKIDFGDLGDILQPELDAVAANTGFSVKPVVKYREYRSDDLNSVLNGPIVLEVTSFAFNREGSSFEAKAPSLNINRTGETYTFDRFPMLRGFI